MPRESIELNSSRRSLADAMAQQIITLPNHASVENLSSAEDRANGVFRFAVKNARSTEYTTKSGSIFDFDPIKITGTVETSELFIALAKTRILT